MKAFRVTCASNDYQRLVVEDDRFWSRPELKRFGKSIAGDWQPPRCRIFNPTKDEGDFLYFSSGMLCIRGRSLEKVRSSFEMAGEILEVRFGDEKAWALNFTEVIDCIDYEMTQWMIDGTGKKIGVKEPVIRSSLLPESTIFKISQQPGTIYVHTGDECEGFMQAYELNRLSGLRFHEVKTC